jgi:hypothetical protein
VTALSPSASRSSCGKVVGGKRNTRLPVVVCCGRASGPTRCAMGVRVRIVLASDPIMCASAAVAPAPRQSLIPPVVPQGCSEKVNASHSLFGAGGSLDRAAAGSSHGEQIVGFDLSFVNTTCAVASLVLILVGRTDFAKTGTFSPNAVIAWRIAAKSGSECPCAPCGLPMGRSGIVPDSL